jgi:hypothetical protein
MKYTWKYKRPQIVKAIMSKKSIAGCITIPAFKLYYRAITIKQHHIGIKKHRKTNGSD